MSAKVTIPRRRARGPLLAIVLAFPAITFASDADDPAAMLEFESVLDGRCQILSEGGKLRVMRNRHPARAIKYRLKRTFIGKPQGLSVGVAPPGGEDVRLGCNRVDGKDQDWILVRAQFIDEESHP